MQKKITAVSLAAAGVVLPALWLAACAVNPVTGERELALVSESQEIALGRDAARQAEATIGLTGDAQLQDYVANLGHALAASSERPDLPWEFQVVDDPVPNAFALPGGFIFVTRGLLSLLDSEAELAAVLGHEIGHVTARHSVSQISRAQLAQLGLGIGSVAAPEAFEEFGQLAGTGLGLLFLKHGRDDERQADQLGFNYIVDEGYDSRQMAEVFAALDASGQLVAASSTPSWLSSHPSGPDRIEAALSRTRSLPANLRGGRVNTEGYLEQIDGLIYGPDPRQGFFDGDTFYHPDLAFSLYVPDDWQRANSAAAVSALSPAGDAAMQLSIASEADAAAAAARFSATPGLSETGSARTRINGRDAVVSRFSVQSEASGPLQGIAAHIEDRNRVYRVLVYGLASNFSGYRATGDRIFESFASIEDRSILNIQAQRLHLMRIDEPMTLAEFDRRHPSTIPIEELAVINQLEGPASRLTQAQWIKQVTE